MIISCLRASGCRNEGQGLHSRVILGLYRDNIGIMEKRKLLISIMGDIYMWVNFAKEGK